jgi:para-aminobenzoate synthetase / 4-amino-4-deoxychorismate lyase
LNAAILSRHPQRPGDWALWHAPREIIAAVTPGEVPGALARVEAAAHDGLHALGFVTYEAGVAFDARFATQTAPRDLPLFWFAVFERPLTYTIPLSGDIAEAPWLPGLDENTYREKIERIKQHIAGGETYQVNYTFPLHATGTPLMKNLFARLHQAQPTPYAMYIETAAFRIASVSPELFFRLDGETITCEPMKGTCRRAPHPALDHAAGETLRNSRKNRAENLMIVDMIRNDLGRIAAPGTVKVDELFKVTPWPTLWQMTSTVSAQTAASLPEIFRAMFPCASITGAPKLKTSEIIAELEKQPRGLYTGAIGWFGPGRRGQFAVAIRTAVQTTHTTYGVGSGIVWDSGAADEYRECLLKARILGDEDGDHFHLLETMRWCVKRGYLFLEGHLERMQLSAQHFGFAFDIHAVRLQLEHAAEHFATVDQRVRVLLQRDGIIEIQNTALEDVDFCDDPESAPLLNVAIDTQHQPVDSPFLYHKTNRREVYDQARERFPGAADVLLINEHGELMEWTNGNVVVRRGDQWLTPPLAAGLLPGVYRRHLLESGRIKEATLPLESLHPDDHLYFINSVRGWRAAMMA